MVDDLVEYLRGLPVKDWGGTVLGALLALAGVIYTQHEKNRALREQRAIDEDKARREAAERRVSGDRTFDIAATQDLTARFKALMDGYEARIVDLTNELKSTKEELREARTEIAALRARLEHAG